MYKSAGLSSLFDTLLEDLVLFPELEYFFFPAGEVQLCRNLFVHTSIFPFLLCLIFMHICICHKNRFPSDSQTYPSFQYNA